MNNNDNQKTKKINISEIKKHLHKEFTADELNINTDQKPEELEKFQKNLYEHYNFNFEKLDLDLTEKNNHFNQNNDDFINKIKEENPILIPNYIQEVYAWSYLNPNNVKRLDKKFISNLRLFGNYNRLVKSYLSEFLPASHILHIGNNYGDLLPKLAEKIGNKGQLDIIDVVPLQLNNIYQKLNHFKNIDVWQQDASVNYYRDYNTIGSFFLLHELPLKVKVEVIDNILEQVKNNNAKAIFIDYHPPINYHPIKPIFNLISNILHPFMNDILLHDIKDLAKQPEQFLWSKVTYFGKMYQKIVVRKNTNF